MMTVTPDTTPCTMPERGSRDGTSDSAKNHAAMVSPVPEKDGSKTRSGRPRSGRHPRQAGLTL